VIPLILNKLVDSAINDSVVISSTDSPSYDVWQSNYYGSGDKTDISYQIYIFDVQNVADLLNGSRPVVVEQGPYAFHEYFNKFNIEFSDGGDTVQYNDQRYATTHNNLLY
jgi:hypothetical protein